MGCTNSQVVDKDRAENNNDLPLNEKNNMNIAITNKQSTRQLKSKYFLYSMNNNDSEKSLLLYTSASNEVDEFTSITHPHKITKEKQTFKSSNHLIALHYLKGLKVDIVNQDKFFILINSNLEVYCLIDGHGPYGHIIGQIIQDFIFSYVEELNVDTFPLTYIKSFEELFLAVNEALKKKELHSYTNYDDDLSGIAICITIRIKNVIYQANVGNVMAYVFNYDRACPSKHNLTQLSFNDSNFNSEVIENGKQMEFNLNPESNVTFLDDPHLINEEIRRIYENGGETRKLSGENKSRIFIKGKYYPGLINTRSLGDQIGNGIGCLNIPHISQYVLKRDNNNFLLMCTDGIINVLPHEKILNILQNNGYLLQESLSLIMSESKQMFRSHLYSPDMTALLKEFKNITYN